MMVGEVAGYVASALVFMTFYMKTMTPLRIVAITSNVAFITYAYVEGLLPVLILHLCLLPLNVLRLRQFGRLMEKTRESARGEHSFESLLPFMSPRRVRAGEVLFRKGDKSREMFYICEGKIRLPELAKTIGKGETVGEIGLFSPEKTRTVTAVCEQDCELLRISEERFLQLYNQNPRFGFHIVRVITSRLIENYERLLLAVSSGDNSAESTTAGNAMQSQINGLDEKRVSADAGPTRNWAKRRALRFYVPAACFVAFLGLLLLTWKATPYVRSVLVRDAAVTTWSHVATAPIDGTIHYAGLSLNAPVGPDGVVAIVQNDHLSRRDYDDARILVSFARFRVSELENYLDEIVSLDKERADAKSQYADEFRTQLDTKIKNLESEISTTGTQLGVLRKIASRKEQLASRGTVSENDADEARLRVSALEVELSKLRSDLRHTRVQREAANSGIFMTSGGTDPDWVFDSRMDLKLEKKEARLEWRKARSDLEVAESAFKAAEEDFRRLSKGPVTAPPGSILWSKRAAPGATVRAGDPVAEWLNCSVLLVDVPWADIEMPLVTVGMEANVILDGETTVRKGSVLMTRGSASTLDRKDLVAVAKGRDEDVAQVVIDISHERENFESCPVARAAFVDFPQIGLLDIVSAWLRL